MTYLKSASFPPGFQNMSYPWRRGDQSFGTFSCRAIFVRSRRRAGYVWCWPVVYEMRLMRVFSNGTCSWIIYLPAGSSLCSLSMFTDEICVDQVMVDGDIPPRVKKDAHALILEFIRGRPPLKKVRRVALTGNHQTRHPPKCATGISLRA